MLNGIYHFFIPHHFRNEVITYSHAKNIVNAAMIALAVTPGFVWLYYYLGFHTAAYVISILGTIIVSSAFLFKYINDLAFMRELIVSMLFICIAWLTFSLGGINSSSTYWLILPPLLSVLLGGMTSAMIWGFVCILTVLGMYSFEVLQLKFPVSPIHDPLLLQLVSTGGLILIVLYLAYFFEKGKRDGALEVQHKNKQLKLSNAKMSVLFKKAIESSRLKSEFLRNMSHELRTPLHAIVGFTELLQREEPGYVNTQEYLHYIKVSVDHLTQMIIDMLDVSTYEFGVTDFHPELVNVVSIVGGVTDIFKSIMIEKKIDFNVYIDDAVAHVTADPIRLKQIFFHYISNAVKFTSENGKIHVRIYPVNPEEFTIEVVDTGSGIHQNDIEKLFMPFQQLDSSLTKRYPGTGTGLALVRRIAEAQGGRVSVESVIGEGSKFFVVLPIKMRE